MREKFKSFIANDQIFYGLLIIMTGIASFYLGRLSVSSATAPSPNFQVIEPLTLPATVVQSTISPSAVTPTQAIITGSEQFVASKNGTKYYLSSCSGVKRIKPENIVSFPSREAAEAAGYSKAANCPGL